MSEQLRNHEHRSHSQEHHKHAHEAHKPHHEARHEHQDNIEHIRAQAAHEAKNAHNIMVEESNHKPKEHFVNAELKGLAYVRTMSRVRRQLSPAGRTFSKVIHQSAVDAVSEGVAKTVGRPSGILGGGILALAGTTAYYYIAKHYGYEYNFGVFLVLMASGFVVGWLAEAIWRILSPKR